MDQQHMLMKMQMEGTVQLIKTCYTDCIQRFDAPQLSAQEKQCLDFCAQRNMAAGQAGQEAMMSMAAKAQGRM